MKIWIGLLLAVLGLIIGLGSTLLDSSATLTTEHASFFGISTADLSRHSPTLVGLAVLMMIASFLLIFSRRNDELEY